MSLFSTFTKSDFIKSVELIQGFAHDIALDKGFWQDTDNKGEKIALMHSERTFADVYANLSRVAPTKTWPDCGVSPEWAAGILDGEGHFGITKYTRKNGRPQYLCRVQIGNTEIALLEPFLHFGSTIKTVDAARWNPNASRCYKWTIHGHQAQDFILAVLPYMRHPKKIKAAKCLLAVEFLRKRAGGNVKDDLRVIQQEHYYQRAAVLNSRGPALEATREEEKMDKHLPQFSNLVVELADCVIRIFDFCTYFKLPLAEAILAKIEFNAQRPHKHGKNF